MRDQLDILAEVWEFLKTRKKWWLPPIIIVLLLVGAILSLASQLVRHPSIDISE